MNDMQLKFDAGNNKKYEVDGIWNSAVYAKKSAKQLSGLYYLVLWKTYPKKENIWEPVLAIQHLWRLVIVFYKDNSEKPIATFVPVDMILPIARPTNLPIVKPTVKPTTASTKKCGRPAKSTTTTTTKWAKKF